MRPEDYATYGDIDFFFQVTGVRDTFENEKVILDSDKTLSNKESIIVSSKRATYIEMSR